MLRDCGALFYAIAGRSLFAIGISPQVTRLMKSIHSEMNSPGIQMAYANRLFLKMVHETGKIGRVAMKPTQAMEDGINAGLHAWLLEGTKFEVGRKYAVNPFEEHRENIEKRIMPFLDDEEKMNSNYLTILKLLDWIEKFDTFLKRVGIENNYDFRSHI